MKVEILFFALLATEKIPDFKTLQVFAGSFSARATETPHFSAGNGRSPLFVEGCRNPILSETCFHYKIEIRTLSHSPLRKK